MKQSELIVSVNAARTPTETEWRALGYYNLYRFLIATLFVSLVWLGHLPQQVGQYDQDLFQLTAHGYLLLSLLAALFTSCKYPQYVFQVVGQILTDIVMITLLMYASGGLSSGFGMLLVIAVAGGGILSPGRLGILFAALATIAVLGHEVYVQLFRYFAVPNYTHAGFLGITFFGTAYIGEVLATRVRVSEALAAQRAAELRSLASLNEEIVQRLQSGIIVLDDNYNVQLLNQSARRLLGLEKSFRNADVSTLAPELASALRAWVVGTGARIVTVSSAKSGVDIQVSFTRLGPQAKFDILIFLEDASILRQHAQQLKLASLGRLTASIAHEVRNPLGAISHAGQLLLEAHGLDDEDRRLISIIQDHSKRMNTIIENVLQLSRRQQAVPAAIELTSWIEQFVVDFVRQNQLDKADIIFDHPDTQVHARMDPTQLHQILTNLCDNALRYSRERPLVRIFCSIWPETGRPYIEVNDRGSGVPAEVHDSLFEPFFTTDSGGTGLGLYIARELCEANQATLILQSSTRQGSCFQINLAHPDKSHSLMS